MPVDWSRYPTDWKEIATAVKEAADWRCEWCGIEHGAEAIGTKGKPYKIVLTVAHLGPNKHDKMDCSHLAALCQRCHLREDHADHIAHGKVTRAARKYGSQPQLELI